MFEKLHFQFVKGDITADYPEMFCMADIHAVLGAYSQAKAVCKFLFYRQNYWSCARDTKVSARNMVRKMKQLPNNGISLEAQYLYRKAQALSMEGKTEDALKYLKKVVFIAPRYSNAYNSMGNCLDELGMYDDAIRKYDKVLEIDPHHTEARFKRTLVIEKVSRTEAVKENNGKNKQMEKGPEESRTRVCSGYLQTCEFPFSLVRIGLNY